MRKNWLIIGLILLLAALLRLVGLSQSPPGLTWDEAANGYNAYSLLTTGRDEYGEPFPLVFRSFGDYKPPLAIYLTIPFVAIFGLTEVAVRLPSALAGISAVFLIYLLARELFPKEKKFTNHPSASLGINQSLITNHHIAFLSAFLLAISPWHIHFSRVGFEANIALTFILLAIWLFLKGDKDTRYWFLSAVFFVLATYTYHSARVVAPLLFLGLAVWQSKLVVKHKLNFLLAALLAGLLALPQLPIVFSPQGSSRAQVMSVFSYPRPEGATLMLASQDHLSPSSLIFQFFHGQPKEFVLSIADRILGHLSPNYLFVQGDYNPRFNIPKMGLLFPWDGLFIALGALVLARKEGRLLGLMGFWILVTILPAALTRDLVSAVRAENLVVPLTLLSGLGAYSLLYNISLRQAKLRFLAVGFAAVFLALAMGYFLNSYFVYLPRLQGEHWLAAYKPAVETMSRHEDSYEQVHFTRFYGQPYIYLLFYKKYPPEAYQPQARLVQETVDVGYVAGFDQYKFAPIDWRSEGLTPKTLYLGTPLELEGVEEKGGEVLEKIFFPNGEEALRLVGVN